MLHSAAMVHWRYSRNSRDDDTRLFALSHFERLSDKPLETPISRRSKWKWASELYCSSGLHKHNKGQACLYRSSRTSLPGSLDAWGMDCATARRGPVVAQTGPDAVGATRQQLEDRGRRK